MPLTFVGSNYSFVNAPNYSQQQADVGLPSGCQPGDLAIAHLHSAGGDTQVSMVSSGWTYITGMASSNYRSAAYWKLLTAADISAGTFRMQSGSGSTNNNPGGGMVQVWRGASAAVSASAVGPVGGSATVPTITTLKANERILLFGGSQSSAGNSSDFSSVPSGYTKLPSYSYQGQGIGGFGYRTALATTPGPYGGETVSGGTNNGQWIMVSLSSNEPPGAPAWKDAGGTADGAVVSRASDTPLAWTPSDADNDPQAGYDFRYRAFGTLGPWTTISRPTAGATASGVIPAGVLSGRCAVQVRTYDAAGPGAWSTERLIVALDPVGAVSSVPSKLDPGMLLALAQVQRLLVPAVT